MSESKVVLPLEEQVIRFLESHGLTDFAFAFLNPTTGAVRSRWLAGDGEDPVIDRKRCGDLHFEMAILQAQIVNHQLGQAPIPPPKPKKSPKRKPAK